MIHDFDHYYKSSIAAGSALMLQVPVWLVDLGEWVKILSIFLSFAAAIISIYKGLQIKKK